MAPGVHQRLTSKPLRRPKENTSRRLNSKARGAQFHQSEKPKASPSTSAEPRLGRGQRDVDDVTQKGNTSSAPPTSPSTHIQEDSGETESHLSLPVATTLSLKLRPCDEVITLPFSHHTATSIEISEFPPDLPVTPILTQLIPGARRFLHKDRWDRINKAEERSKKGSLSKTETVLGPVAIRNIFEVDKLCDRLSESDVVVQDSAINHIMLTGDSGVPGAGWNSVIVDFKRPTQMSAALRRLRSEKKATEVWVPEEASLEHLIKSKHRLIFAPPEKVEAIINETMARFEAKEKEIIKASEANSLRNSTDSDGFVAVGRDRVVSDKGLPGSSLGNSETDGARRRAKRALEPRDDFYVFQVKKKRMERSQSRAEKFRANLQKDRERIEKRRTNRLFRGV